jgi:SAM-dependent methyltransferase
MENLNLSRFLRLQFILIFLSALFTSLSAQEVQGDKNFEPYSGQAGKDVVWVPTPQVLVDKMLDIAKVTPNDFVIDLGSGDGRTVITAAKRGAKARGVEFNPNMVALSKKNAEKEGVDGKAEFVQGDLFQTDLSQATVITMFLLTEINLKLRPALLELKPGTRIVTNTFRMGDWEPDETVTAPDCDSWCDALLWIVPAKIAGIWLMPDGEMKLDQEFQMVTGMMRTSKDKSKISDGRLKGNQITFMANNEQYTGIINGNSIAGTITSNGKNREWNAKRAGN